MRKTFFCFLLLVFIGCLCSCKKEDSVNVCNHEWFFDYSTATCYEDGYSFYTCQKCNEIKKENESRYECIDWGNDGYCDLCFSYIGGVSSPVAEWISNRSISFVEDEDLFRFCFALKDKDYNFIKCDATIEMKIVNTEGEIIYVGTKKVTASDYGLWYNSYEEWTGTAISIGINEIKEGFSSEGTFYYKVVAGENWFEYSLKIYNLPTKKASLLIPDLPKSIASYGWDNDLVSTVRITNITYEIDGNDLYIYFTGEKTFDTNGLNFSRACEVGWKLYDSEGYIVESGTFYSPAIEVGEKFKNEKIYVWDVIEIGKTYTLKISDVA